MAAISTIDSSDSSIAYYPSGFWISDCPFHASGSRESCVGTNSSGGQLRHTFTGTGVEVVAILGGGQGSNLLGNVWSAAIVETGLTQTYTASFTPGQAPTTTTIFSTSGLSQATYLLQVTNLNDVASIILWLDSLIVFSSDASQTGTTPVPTPQPTTSLHPHTSLQPNTSLQLSTSSQQSTSLHSNTSLLPNNPLRSTSPITLSALSQVTSTLLQPTSSGATSPGHSLAPTQLPSQRPRGTNVSAIVGGTVAGIVLLALLLFITRRQHYARRALHPVSHPSASEGSTTHSLFSGTSSRSSRATVNGGFGWTGVTPSTFHTSNQSTLAETTMERLSSPQQAFRGVDMVDSTEKELVDYSMSTPQQEARDQSDHPETSTTTPITIPNREDSVYNDTDSHALPAEVDAALSYAPRELRSQVAAMFRSLLMGVGSRTNVEPAPGYELHEGADDEPLPQYSER